MPCAIGYWARKKSWRDSDRFDRRGVGRCKSTALTHPQQPMRAEQRQAAWRAARC